MIKREISQETRQFFLEKDLIVFATSSDDKAIELNRIIRRIDPDFPIIFTARTVELKELQDVDVVTVAEDKALRVPGCLVEDTSLGLTEKGGYPGALVKWLLRSFGNDGICALANLTPTRRAQATTIFSISPDGKAFDLFRGDVWGRISAEPLGDQGFGWDKVFIPEGQPDGARRTFGQMFDWEKDTYSMRMRAVEHMVNFVMEIRSK